MVGTSRHSSPTGSRSATCSSSRRFPDPRARLGRARRTAAARPAPVAAAASALLVLAIPFETLRRRRRGLRHADAAAWWAILSTRASRLGSRPWLSLVRVFAAVFVLVPTPLCARPAGDRPRLLGRRAPADLVRAVPVRLQAGRRRCVVPGNPRRRRATGSIAPCPRAPTSPCCGPDRSDRFTVEPERVLQPQGRPGLLHRRPTPGGIGESRSSPTRAPVPSRPRRPSAPARYLLTDGSVDPERRTVARDPQLGMTVWKVDGPLVLAKTTNAGSTAGHAGPGRGVTWTREHCRGGSLTVSLLGATRAASRTDMVAASRRQRQSRGRRTRSRPLRVPLTRTQRDVRRPLPVSPTAVPSGRDPGQNRHPGARRPTSAPSRTRPVRIAFDVSPLSHRATGIGNYIRGSLAGSPRRPAGEHEIVAFAPTSSAGRRGSRRRSTGIPVELRLRVLPFSHPLRMAWSRRGRPPVERFLGPVDALHFSDWMYPPQRGGVRATTIHDLVPLRFPEWVTPRTREMHGEKYAQHRAHVRRDLLNSAYTGERRRRAARRRRASASVVAHPGVEPCSRPTGAAPSSAAVRARRSPRSSRARTCGARRGAPRCSTATRCSRSRAARAGASSRSSTIRGVRAARLRLGRGAAGSTAAPRSSSTRRGSRASGSRSSRRWPAAHPSSRRRTPRWTRPAATRPFAPIPTIRRRSPPRSSRRSPRASELVPPGSRTPPGSPGVPRVRSFLRGYEEAQCASAST